MLPNDLGAAIDLSALPQSPIMKWLRTVGNVTEVEMLKTFNCGIGMIVIVNPAHVIPVTSKLTQYGETVFKIGCLKSRKPNSSNVVIENTDSWLL
jgi:phosphoribosylaminoimidazole (AIR) synthetase